jgi:V-type H+-transporting ATPase subunit E
MYKLQEPTVVLRCREEDVSVVQSQAEPARKTFKATYGVEAPTITVDKKTFLSPGPKKGVEGVYCAGGVIVLSADGKIQCNNTLDHR